MRKLRSNITGLVMVDATTLLTGGDTIPAGAQVDESLLEPLEETPEHGDTQTLESGDAGGTEEPAATDHEPIADGESSVAEPEAKPGKQTRARTAKAAA